MRAAGHDLRVFDDPRNTRSPASPFRLYGLCLNGRPSSMGLLRAAVQAVELSSWKGPSGSELEIEVSIGWTDGVKREVALGLARMSSAADHLRWLIDPSASDAGRTGKSAERGSDPGGDPANCGGWQQSVR